MPFHTGLFHMGRQKYFDLIESAVEGVLSDKDFKIKSFQNDESNVNFVIIVLQSGLKLKDSFENIEKKVLNLAHDLVFTNYFICRNFATVRDEPSEYNNVAFVKTFVQNNTNLEIEIKKRFSDAFDNYLHEVFRQIHE